jgi:ParB family transcriptional regulator, chromosome partitioning protein
MRDLFEQDDGGWLRDVPLLDRLVTEKLKAEAEIIAAEGWKWIAALNFPYGHTDDLRELDGVQAELTENGRAMIDALKTEFDKLEADYQEADELPDGLDQRLGEIEAALSAFEARVTIYDPADIDRAGVFVSIDDEGALSVDRGYVRPEDEVPVVVDVGTESAVGRETADGERPAVLLPRTVITVGSAPVEPEDDDDDAIKPLPDRLITELTAHRTLALRNALANDPAVGFAAVLHNFVLATFCRFATSSGCLEIAVRSPTLPAQAPGLNDSASAKAIETRHDAWKVLLPKEEGDLWDKVIAFDETERSSLFAHCASFGVNALYELTNRYNEGRVSAHGGHRRLEHADILARAVGLDMVATGWTTSVDNYRGRVTNPAFSKRCARPGASPRRNLSTTSRKATWHGEAERLLEGTGWLLEPLRLADTEGVSDAAIRQADALPEFLADDDNVKGEDQPHVVATE